MPQAWAHWEEARRAIEVAQRVYMLTVKIYCGGGGERGKYEAIYTYLYSTKKRERVRGESRIRKGTVIMHWHIHRHNTMYPHAYWR